MENEKDILKARARTLRKEMTAQERHLWYDFLKSYPVHFRRQQIFGNYIVDFYCPQAKLVIELDGSQHYEPEKEAYDQARTEALNRFGVCVVRYANNQIDHEFRAVCDNIDHIIRKRLNMKP